MVVIFNENNKRLELSIVGYEFPLEKGMDEFDANWLIVQFDYYEDENFSSYTDNCLLVTELENLIQEIEEVISGKKLEIIRGFFRTLFKVIYFKN